MFRQRSVLKTINTHIYTLSRIVYCLFIIYSSPMLLIMIRLYTKSEKSININRLYKKHRMNFEKPIQSNYPTHGVHIIMSFGYKRETSYVRAYICLWTSCLGWTIYL